LRVIISLLDRLEDSVDDAAMARLSMPRGVAVAPSGR
jgi:hypothetical protein